MGITVAISQPFRDHAYRDGWCEAIDLPERPDWPLDVSGHSDEWLAGFHAGRATVGASDVSI